jgi:hypothetical protein
VPYSKWQTVGVPLGLTAPFNVPVVAFRLLREPVTTVGAGAQVRISRGPFTLFSRDAKYALEPATV